MHISYIQNKYLTAVERIQYMLIQVIHKLHDISCRKKKPFAPIFLAIIHNKYWKDTYMADVLRFEKKHFHKMRASLLHMQVYFYGEKLISEKYGGELGQVN